MRISELKLTEVKIAAFLHRQNLESPGSGIGSVYLENFYRYLILNPKIHINLKAEVEGVIVGVATFSKDLAKTNHILLGLLNVPLLAASLFAIISGRVKTRDLVNRFIFERKVVAKNHGPYATILTLFVSGNYRRRGVGKKLVRELIIRLKNDRACVIHVDSYLKNKKALAFYEALGFKKEEQITDSAVLEKKF